MIEMRWLDDGGYCRLQYRLREYLGGFEEAPWGEWQDVPTQRDAAPSEEKK